nr:unnamed protein product [Callosobruchus analis]
MVNRLINTWTKIRHHHLAKKMIYRRRRRVMAIIHKFYEDDSNSRCAAEKKECITRCSVKNLPYNEFDNSVEILVKQWRNSKKLIQDIKTTQERFLTIY